MLLTPVQIKPKSFEWRRNLFFLTQGGCISCLCACLGARLLPQSYQYPNLSEDADRVGGQLRGDKECPFSGVTKSGSVWRKVPESDAWSVTLCDSVCVCVHTWMCMYACACAHVHTWAMAVPQCIFVCIYKHTTGNITDHRGSKCQKNIHK